MSHKAESNDELEILKQATDLLGVLQKKDLLEDQIAVWKILFDWSEFRVSSLEGELKNREILKKLVSWKPR